jgi:hypothetical protein
MEKLAAAAYAHADRSYAKRNAPRRTHERPCRRHEGACAMRGKPWENKKTPPQA